MEQQQFNVERLTNVLSNRNKLATSQETNFGHLYAGSYSFDHYPTLMMIGEKRNKKQSKNKKLCFRTHLLCPVFFPNK